MEGPEPCSNSSNTHPITQTRILLDFAAATIAFVILQLHREARASNGALVRPFLQKKTRKNFLFYRFASLFRSVSLFQKSLARSPRAAGSRRRRASTLSPSPFLFLASRFRPTRERRARASLSQQINCESTRGREENFGARDFGKPREAEKGGKEQPGFFFFCKKKRGKTKLALSRACTAQKQTEKKTLFSLSFLSLSLPVATTRALPLLCVSTKKKTF